MSNNAATDDRKPLMTKVLVGLVVILIIALYWAIDIKWKDVEVNAGFDTEARKNPYLAAELFIEQSRGDVTDSKSVVESQRGFGLVENLPSIEDTVIITSARYSMSDRRTELLIDWINQGGNLIVTGKMQYSVDNQSSSDSLLDHFGIQVHEADLSQDENSEQQNDNSDDIKSGEAAEEEDEILPQTIGELMAKTSEDNAMACKENPLFSPIPTGGDFPDATANIASDNVLHYADLDKLYFWASDGYGPQIIQLTVGKGMLTVLTDMSLWKNRELGCFDNAFLLQQLTRNSNKVWLLFDEDMPDIMTLLWQKNHNLVITALILLAFWLWSQSLRFGPIKQVQQTIRRNFSEHIEATARYRWRSGEGEQIIELLRHQILQKVTLRHGDLPNMDQQQQIELIDRLSDSNPADIKLALFDSIGIKDEQIVGQVQRLQQLRKQLC